MKRSYPTQRNPLRIQKPDLKDDLTTEHASFPSLHKSFICKLLDLSSSLFPRLGITPLPTYRRRGSPVVHARAHPPSSTRSALLPQRSHTQDRKTAPCLRLSVALGSLGIEIMGPGPHLKGRYGIPEGELQINQKQGLVPGGGVSRPEGDLSVGSKFLLWSLNCGPGQKLGKKQGEESRCS